MLVLPPSPIAFSRTVSQRLAQVRFKDYNGFDSFEILDSGSSGIAPADYDPIAVKHRTSKLASFSGLDRVAIPGPHGEAFSSLCALARTVSVTTVTAAEALVGAMLSFDRTCKFTSHTGKATRPVSSFSSQESIPSFSSWPAIGLSLFESHPNI